MINHRILNDLTNTSVSQMLFRMKLNFLHFMKEWAIPKILFGALFGPQKVLIGFDKMLIKR